MRFTSFFLLVLLLVAPNAKASNNDIELLDSNLIAKLHFADIAKDGQMVGAYVVSFRPKKGRSVNKVTVLLNPGLEFIKADAGRSRLAANSRLTLVTGMDLLELNKIEIDLGKTLTGTDRIDIAIHYRGFLEELSWTGLTGVKETLSPNFTMLRAQAFAYPVFAEANLASIKNAWANKGFLQFADITLPGANVIVGTLDITEKNLVGEQTKVALKSNRPTNLMALAIAPYQSLSSGPVTASFLHGGEAGAKQLLGLVAGQMDSLANLLGAPTSGATLNIINVPNGYGNSAATGALFLETSFLSAPSLTPKIKKTINDLWKSNNAGKSGNWSNGLDKLIDLEIANPDMMQEFQMMTFNTAEQLFGANKLIGKTALEDYVVEGLLTEGDNVSGLAFAVLYNLLGRDEFFKMVRNLRADLNSGYADMATVAEFLQKNLRNKKAKKFAKNWFSSGKAGKDMAKAASFHALVKRYK